MMCAVRTRWEIVCVRFLFYVLVSFSFDFEDFVFLCGIREWAAQKSSLNTWLLTPINDFNYKQLVGCYHKKKEFVLAAFKVLFGMGTARWHIKAT